MKAKMLTETTRPSRPTSTRTSKDFSKLKANHQDMDIITDLDSLTSVSFVTSCFLWGGGGEEGGGRYFVNFLPLTETKTFVHRLKVCNLFSSAPIKLKSHVLCTGAQTFRNVLRYDPGRKS